MKKVYKYLAVICLLGLTAGTFNSCKKQVPEPKPQEQEQETPEPEPEPEKPAFQTDIAAALEADGTLVKQFKTNESFSPHKGVYVTTITYTDGNGDPQAAYIMQVDLTEPTIDLVNTAPHNAKKALINQPERLSEQFKRIDADGCRVIGGVNTDFFVTAEGYSHGYPQGAFYRDYVCLKSTFSSQTNRPRCTVSWGDDKVISILTYNEYKDVESTAKFKNLFSGGQKLISGGAITNYKADSVAGVNPRTMIGVSQDGKRLILVVIDGRREGYSIGVDYPDMQKFMKAAGSWESINLDGGGSSTFIVRKEGAGYYSDSRFQPRNRPSDGTERAIGPGLAIVATDE